MKYHITSDAGFRASAKDRAAIESLFGYIGKVGVGLQRGRTKYSFARRDDKGAFNLTVQRNGVQHTAVVTLIEP